MANLSKFLTADHKTCDEFFTLVEDAVAEKSWPRAIKQWEIFQRSFLRHLQVEEEILFPFMDKEAGGAMGPTTVMRQEHQQMRTLLSEMAESMKQENSQEFLGAADTLLMLMQQHNLKEENILYPMSDEMLMDDESGVMNQIREMRDSI